MNDNGFVPRRNNEERKSVFNKETIRSMMENPIYVGYLIHRNSDSEDGYEYFESKQYAIIDKELFDQVDDVRKSRVANHAHNKADGVSLKKNYLVQNLICCAECGNRLRVHPSKRCYRYVEYSANRGLECKFSGEYVEASFLDEQVRNFLAKIIIPRSWADFIEKKADGEDYISEIQKKIKAIQDRIKRRTNAYTISGTYSFEDFQKEHNADMAEIEELQSKLPKSSNVLNTQITITTSLIDLVKIASAPEQYDIVHYLFKNLYFDFQSYRLCAFEPNAEFDFLFATFADKNGWKKVEDRYLISESDNDEH